MTARHLTLAGIATVGLAGVALLWPLRPHRVAFTPNRNRNVLLVTIDTLRADALGAYGGQAATPNLDRLAAEGVRFTDAHAHSVVTLPSHTSILTGLYPFSHGVRDNSGYRLAPGATTLATVLKHVGYATGAFVGAFPLDARWGLNQGFDDYDDHYGNTNRIGDLLMPERRAEVVVAAATAWIRQQPDTWAAWVHVYDPHAPYRPPAPFDQQYAGNPYAGEVAYTDRALGPLLDLARSGPRGTLIVVTADHGEALGSHGEQTHGLFAYEPTLHVPFIVDVTDRAHALGASPSDLPVRHVDILPTVLDALGVAAPNGLPGRSILRALDEGDSTPPPSYFESLSPFLNRGWAPLTGVVVGHEKYIDLPIPELYDLATDPGEEHNLLPARDDRRRVLEGRLRDTGWPGTNATGARVQENAEVRSRLQALGYVSGSTVPKARYTDDDDPKRLVELDRMIQEGVNLFQTGRAREALALSEQLIRRRPSMSSSRLHAAFLRWALGDPAGAIETLREALRAGADAPDVRIQLGIYLAEGGSPQEAVRLLDPLQREAFPDLDGLNGLGIALSHLGRQAEALAVFDRILQLDPNNAGAHQNKGTVYLTQGKLAEARESLARALQRDPDLPVALNGMGVVELKSGNARAGIEAWKRAVQVDSRQYDTLFNLGVTLLDMGEREAARQYFEQFVRTAPPAFYRKDIENVRATLRRLAQESKK
ncbi:MAG: tetratricopeptide repeat protein [Acidobacteria bacterium]|nr:tetratricopeptide repeat protein [Acidobacteriota bacterium]